ncbi:unnamed protein product [Effrenium voratum]|uniref:AB hydrolase-1 domain-containing protein n=1 Tax=Effrenium voratum TaxID=2562239 RepID=A0AA36N3L3_9DINO|nr:unnamed protein product [Effrenium voratum]
MQEPMDIMYDTMDVPLGQAVVKLKRFMDKEGLMRSVQRSLRAPPPVLILHDGPGLPSRYLEPLAERLCSPAGRTCYMYDELGCGLSTASIERPTSMRFSVQELQGVLQFLRASLGEDEVHIIAHGHGGAVLMEALLRYEMEGLPTLRSICLLGVPSSTACADEAARSLMRKAVLEVGDADAARAFWYRHVCALKPQPRVLAEAYERSGTETRWGALRGWHWKMETRDNGLTGRWELRGPGLLEDWSITRAEVAAEWQKWKTVPVLSLRGQHDFVTKECMAAWRGVCDKGVAFTETCLGSCGHHAHLEVSDFLQMEGPPEAHHVLKEKGLLHEWQPGMLSVFISHQWLGNKFPDPSGHQLAVLRKVLRRFIDRSLKVEQDMTRIMSKENPTSYEQIQHGYLFLDWFAIPQITARTDGVNEDATRSDAALAVQSIPAYVEACDLFFALVPELVHVDTGHECNYETWLSRGWCRAELWCRLLSNRQDTSVIVIFSDVEALYIFPLDWQRNLISDGLFTVESDRAGVVKLGEMALHSKIQHLRQRGPLSHYRFHLANRPRLLNQEKAEFDLPGFLQHFDFPSLEAAVKEEEEGMTGMLCAVFAGDCNMLRLLAEQRADANGKVVGLTDLGYYDTQTLLMAAAKSAQNAKVLSTLMLLRADPNLSSRAGLTAAYLSHDPSHVHVLLENKADLVNCEIPPLFGAAGRASSATVKALLEGRCSPSQTSLDGFGVLHAVPMFGGANPHASETIRLLLSFRADVNLPTAPKSRMKEECWRCRVSIAIWGSYSTSYQRKIANLTGATPLAIAAMMGNRVQVQTLLENNADSEISNGLGHTPLDLARQAGQCHLLSILGTFAV